MTVPMMISSRITPPITPPITPETNRHRSRGTTQRYPHIGEMEAKKCKNPECGATTSYLWHTDCCTVVQSYFDHFFLLKILLHSPKCKRVMYSRFKKTSKVCHFHFKMPDLIFHNKKCINPYKIFPLIVIHIIIHISSCCRIIFLL